MSSQVNTQVIPPIGPLMATMPSGREVHSLKSYIPPTLDSSILESMRAPPGSNDDYGKDASSDEEVAHDPVGAFPGTRAEYSGSGSYY
jgi:hypothetical protein